MKSGSLTTKARTNTIKSTWDVDTSAAATVIPYGDQPWNERSFYSVLCLLGPILLWEITSSSKLRFAYIIQFLQSFPWGRWMNESFTLDSPQRLWSSSFSFKIVNVGKGVIDTFMSIQH